MIQSARFILMSMFVAMLFSTHSFATDDERTIKIASIDWCPQLCPKEEKKGYIHDLVTEIYTQQGYQLDIETMPWSRAIALTRKGTRVALLSPAKAEAPDLRYPGENVGTQQMCFFTGIKSDWTYRGKKSLENLSIGIANDTSIEELNYYVQANKEQFQFLPYGQHYISTSLKKLDLERIDAFLFTLNTTNHEIKKAGLQNIYRSAGCVSKSNIYIAFSPAESVWAEVDELIKVFDEGIKNLRRTNQAEDILSVYGIEQ